MNDKQVWKYKGGLHKTLLTLALTFGMFRLCAFDFEVDQQYYNLINNDSVEITFKDTLYNSYPKLEVYIPPSIVYNGKQYTVSRIGDRAFLDCTNLRTVFIPEGISEIGNTAFGACENLESIELPQSIKVIAKYAFFSCISLTTVTIPPKVTRIEEATFLKCEGLQKFEIPENINSIGSIAFLMCKNLEEITLSKNIEKLGACAIFNNCRGLKILKVLSPAPPLLNPSMVFDIDFQTCKLIVPAGSKEAYVKAEVWKEFSQIEEFKL